jgi:hypothetical protein
MKITAGILALYLLLGSFFPKNDFRQLLSLHFLWEHFQEHVETAQLSNMTLDFFDYIWIHFIEAKDHQGDHDQQNHDRLPLHNSPIGFDYLFYILSWSEKPLPQVDRLDNPLILRWLSSEFISHVFRPPLV